MTTPRNRVRSAWQRIDRVLEREVPEVADDLDGPASEDELRALVDVLGGVPEDLLTSLRVHNGHLGDYLQYTVFDHNWLLSAPKIIEDWKMRNEIHAGLGPTADRWWHPRYVPFTDSDGDAYCVERSASNAPIVMHAHDQGMDEIPCGVSLADFLEDLAARYDAGRYIKDDGVLWPHHPDMGRTFVLSSHAATITSLTARLKLAGKWHVFAGESEIRVDEGFLTAQLLPRDREFTLCISGFLELDEALAMAKAIELATEASVRLLDKGQY